MLVLSRKSGEQITIGPNIKVTVVHIGGGRVRLGVQAPLDVAVHRQEIAARIQRQKLPAGNVILWGQGDLQN